MRPDIVWAGTGEGNPRNSVTGGYPTVSTYDMAIQPHEQDLVIGTFGHGVWILDDIRPLRALATDGRKLLNSKLAVFDPPVAYLASTKNLPGYYFYGDAMYRVQNREPGMETPDSDALKRNYARTLAFGSRVEALNQKLLTITQARETLAKTKDIMDNDPGFAQKISDYYEAVNEEIAKLDEAFNRRPDGLLPQINGSWKKFRDTLRNLTLQGDIILIFSRP